MKKLVIEPGKFFDELKNRTALTPEDEKYWKYWVDFKNREWRDLYALIASDVRPEFKKRAILILLAPTPKWIPFYFKQEASHKHWCDRKFILTLTPDLAIYTADLVAHFCGLFLDLGENHKHIKALDFYNHCIINLLPLIPDKNAEELIELFQIDLLAGGVFFHYFLEDDKVPFQWKKIIDSRMRTIIHDEKMGKGSVRSKLLGESAIELYAKMIERVIYRENGNLTYTFDFFAEQVHFLIDNHSSDEKYPLLSRNYLFKYLKLFAGDEHEFLRLKIARYLILHKFEEFKIYCNDALEASKMVLNEFGDSDEELSDVLRPAINVGQLSLEESAKEASDKRLEANRIFVGMC